MTKAHLRRLYVHAVRDEYRGMTVTQIMESQSLPLVCIRPSSPPMLERAHVRVTSLVVAQDAVALWPRFLMDVLGLPAVHLIE